MLINVESKKMRWINEIRGTLELKLMGSFGIGMGLVFSFFFFFNWPVSKERKSESRKILQVILLYIFAQGH